MMTKTVTVRYTTLDAARSAVDELLAEGLEPETVFLDAASKEIKVMVPSVIEREVLEVLDRHHPAQFA